jgi:hypothetical protein
VRNGIVVQLLQTRIPRALHAQMKAEAAKEGVTLGRWMLQACASAIERKRKSAMRGKPKK